MEARVTVLEEAVRELLRLLEELVPKAAPPTLEEQHTDWKRRLRG